MEIATSDANDGLKNAVTKLFPGVIWQRCQAHFRRNVIDQTPASLREEMHDVLDKVLEASDPDEARAEMEAARRELAGQADKALGVLEAGWEDATAVLALPEKYRRRLRTTNMLERFNEEIMAAGEGDPHLPQFALRVAARGGALRRTTRGMVHRKALPQDGRILPLER